MSKLTYSADTASTLPAHLNRPRKKRASKPQPAQPRQAAYLRGHYSGQELAPYTGRPGALDHLLLPSRVGSTLHYRNLSSIQTARSERM